MTRAKGAKGIHIGQLDGDNRLNLRQSIGPTASGNINLQALTGHFCAYSAMDGPKL
jgi:hypothetical protein